MGLSTRKRLLRPSHDPGRVRSIPLLKHWQLVIFERLRHLSNTSLFSEIAIVAQAPWRWTNDASMMKSDRKGRWLFCLYGQPLGYYSTVSWPVATGSQPEGPSQLEVRQAIFRMVEANSPSGHMPQASVAGTAKPDYEPAGPAPCASEGLLQLQPREFEPVV
jgi:hypothetical protein